MSRGSACASRRDRAFVLPEDPQQQRRLAERRARRCAVFAARMPAIMAQMKSGISEAIAEALQATRAEHLKEVDLAPTTTTTSVISESSTSIQMSGGSSSIFTAGGGASSSHNFDLPSAVPITCSTDCPRRDNGDATATTSASAAGAVSTTWVLPESTTVAAASFASTPCESSTVPAVCVIDKPPWTAEPEATIPAFKRNSSTAPLDSASIPMVSSHLASKIAPVMPTTCSMECFRDDTFGETPVSAPSACSSSLKRLVGSAPPAGTVFGCDDAELVIATQLPDDSLKHFPVSWFFFVPVRGTTATTAGIQVTSLFLSAEDVSTIVPPIAVSTVLFLLLYDVRPLPWPSFLDCHHVGDQILLMLCSLFTCSPGGTCQEHPMPPPQIISLIGRSCSCSGLISVETTSLSCLQCVQLQLCNFTVLQRLYSFSELSCCCEPWMSWQLQFSITAPRIVSSIYDLLISLKTRCELDMRPELSLQPDILALGCCSIVLQTMSICCALQITQFPWFLASSIQPGAPIFLGTDCYFLIALIYMQQCPVWEVCFSFPKLQYCTEFGSTTQADQNKYRTEDYMKSIRGTCFWFGTVGNASIYGSSHFQWYIAWANTLAQAAVPTIHLARPIIILLTAETLASIPGMQFLLGGATVHYSAIFQLEIAWELELECFDGSSQLRQPISLAGVIELLDIIYAG